MTSSLVDTSQIHVEPVRLPMTSEAKFLRDLGIASNATSRILEMAAAALNNFQTNVRKVVGWQAVTAEQMPALIDEADGKDLPHGSPGKNEEKPPCRRVDPRRLRQ